VTRSDWPLPFNRLARALDSATPRDLILFVTPTLAMLLSVTLTGDTMAEVLQPGPRWSDEQIAELQQLVRQAPDDGLPAPGAQALEAALSMGRSGRADAAATALALRLARSHLSGAATIDERSEWHIVDADAARQLEPELAAALQSGPLSPWIESLRPAHPAYASLREALALEADPGRRVQIARNMERWRWLPRDLGADYVMANAAGFDVALWRGGSQVQSWPAISGKKTTQTPSVAALATAINFNPWWEVPESIAKESRMSARRGYVLSGKRYRQRPGPSNSLGRMKVVMYNPHNIYLHDTPSKGLFGANERAFSHGCIRVSDALGFARTLLGRSDTDERLEKILEEDGKSVLVPLPQSLPVYVTYFTVEPGKKGGLRFHRDIYGRDGAIASIAVSQPSRLAAR
jgi:murein L,D-transpeptidase YcbB/YkuD